MLFLAACSSMTTAPDSGGPVAPVSQVIGPAGGTVSTAGGTSLSVPAGALTSSTTITISAAPSAPTPVGAIEVGAAFDFGPEGQQFAVPVSVTLAFSPQALPAGKTAADVVILTAPVGSGSFASLGGTQVDATQVETTTTHFSIFVPAVLIEMKDGGSSSGSTSGTSTIAQSTSTSATGGSSTSRGASGSVATGGSSTSGASNGSSTAGSATTGSSGVGTGGSSTGSSSGSLACGALPPASCPIGSPCLLARNQPVYVLSLAVDDANVYWVTEENGGSVMAAPLDGGAPLQLATSSYPGAVAVYDGIVYWGTDPGLNGGIDSVTSVPAQGGTLQPLFDGGGTLTNPANVIAIAAGPEGIFWSVSGGYAGGTNAIYELGPNGTGATQVASYSLFGTAEIAVTPMSVFWISTDAQSTSRLMRLDLDAGTVSAVVKIDAGVGTLAGVATDGQYLYWTTEGFGPAGTVNATSILDGTTVILASMLQAPSAIATDSTSIFWINQGYSSTTGSVMQMPLLNGPATPITLAAGISPEALATDCQYVYWSDANGTINRVAKQVILDGGGKQRKR